MLPRQNISSSLTSYDRQNTPIASHLYVMIRMKTIPRVAQIQETFGLAMKSMVRANEKEFILFQDAQAQKYRALDDWFQTPQGTHVAEAFVAELSLARKHLKGNTLLQLGNCGNNIWLSMLRFSHQWLVSPCVASEKSTLTASLHLLPLERDSINCVIAPLTLEAFGREHHPLDEIDRILKPNGHVIFFGINPCSFWGGALHWRHLMCFGAAGGTLTSSLALKRMMLHRGYRQCSLTSFYYIPPITNGFLIRKLAFLNEMGKMVWPYPAGFYCLIMQKYQYRPLIMALTATEQAQWMPALG